MVGSGEGQVASLGLSIKHRARGLVGSRELCTPAQCPAPRGRQHSCFLAAASRKELSLISPMDPVEAKSRDKKKASVSSAGLQGGSSVMLGWPGQGMVQRRGRP